jgi:hypothetical protein
MGENLVLSADFGTRGCANDYRTGRQPLRAARPKLYFQQGSVEEWFEKAAIIAVKIEAFILNITVARE